MLLRRFTLFFYRISTYQRLVKVLLVMGYALGLSAFFGLFIASDNHQQEPAEPDFAAPDNNPLPNRKAAGKSSPKTTQPADTATTSEKNQNPHQGSKAAQYNRAVQRVSNKLKEHLGREKTRIVTKIANHAIDDLEHSRIVTPAQAEKLRIPPE